MYIMWGVGGSVCVWGGQKMRGQTGGGLKMMNGGGKTDDERRKEARKGHK